MGYVVGVNRLSNYNFYIWRFLGKKGAQSIDVMLLQNAERCLLKKFYNYLCICTFHCHRHFGINFGDGAADPILYHYLYARLSEINGH